MAVNIGKLAQPQLYNYQYDQLNRLTGMDTYRGLNEAGNSWSVLTLSEDYKERISYDGNGNILTYLRNGSAATGKLAMDQLSYGYSYNSARQLVSNRLRHVKDAVAAGNYSEDIDSQADDNYSYDAIGNLTYDEVEGIVLFNGG